MTPIEQILDLARWAPSGDNTQPWRFQITGDHSCIVHAFDTRDHCVYDLDGAASQISIGALLETARIAATGLGMRALIERRPGCHPEKPMYSLLLQPDSGVEPSDLIPVIRTRCTNRRPYTRVPLSAEAKAALEASVGKLYSLVWIDGPRRRAVASLMFRSAKIRLTIKEAYDVHAAVIDWHSQFSDTKIPDQAVGLDPVGLALMRWAMKSWVRTRTLSRYFAGTILPRIELEWLPALFCGAHVVVCSARPPTTIDDYVDAGGAVQRLWLTAARLGLQHQPEMTPLIFARYSREGRDFASDGAAKLAADTVRRDLESVLAGADPACAVWMGRVGTALPPEARSLRRPLPGLLAPGESRQQQERD